MQKQKPGESNLESRAIRVTRARSVSRKHQRSIIALWLVAVFLFTSAGAQETNKSKPEPLMIQEQGSFAVGGSVIKVPGTFDPIKQGVYNPAGTDPAGQTLHGDHAYVFYQVPVNARKLPLVFWHGHGQSAKTWETTPDGREGFQNIFLRRRFPVYLIDQPRRGRAARGTQLINITATADEQLWFGIFRLGAWPEFYPGVQFSRDPDALNQFFRQMVPNTGPYDVQVNTEAVSTLFNKIGPGILVTHSQSGGLGWRTAIKNRNVRAIVSYEPAFDFPFPEGDVPPPMTLGGRALSAVTVSQSDFMLLTKIPIIIYYGDNIPDKPSANPGQEQWRIFFEMAKRWRDVVNRHGGDVTVVHLPEIGIRGNTHFPMSDMNNLQIADQMSKFLSEKKLD
jgi:pimeloyl-ACP methyl ester carboxylesterase